MTVTKQAIKRTLLPSPGPRRLPVGIGRGLRMQIDFRHQTHTYAGLYEIEINRHLRRMLRPGVAAFDVGAQHGYDSLVIAKHTRAPVAAFECDPACLDMMSQSFALNPGLARFIQPVRAMVGHDVGLDDWAFEGGFLPAFMKVDIEGGELNALRSARRLLSDHHPALVVEVHSADLEQACGRLLVDCGYRPVIVNPRRWLPDHRPGTTLNRWLVAAR